MFSELIMFLKMFSLIVLPNMTPVLIMSPNIAPTNVAGPIVTLKFFLKLADQKIIKVVPYIFL